ncbi:hypothetical protein HDV00_007429 [Rhizophlyctis rosea]|nr:hypothetical protein HDV00_007429 [Rhizophlyctis rosea]
MTIDPDFRPPVHNYRSFAQYSPIEYTAYIGTEFQGVDLTKLTDENIEDLKIILAERGVVWFRGQDNLTEEAHIALGGRLGKHHIHPSWTGKRGPIFVTEQKQNWANHWHSDVTFDEEPVKYSILKLEELPAIGGDTAWASAELAYYKLSPSLRNYLATLTAEHDSSLTFGANSSNPHVGNNFRKEFGDGEKPRFPRAIHPVIRTHPITGRHAVFVNRGFTTRILDLSRSESDTLLNFLYNLIDRGQELQTRFRWSKNSVAIWDNTHTQHKAIGDFLPYDRKGFRVSTTSEKPYYDESAKKSEGIALYESEGWKHVLNVNNY